MGSFPETCNDLKLKRFSCVYKKEKHPYQETNQLYSYNVLATNHPSTMKTKSELHIHTYTGCLICDQAWTRELKTTKLREIGNCGLGKRFRRHRQIN